MACGPSLEAETTHDAMPDMRPSQVVLDGYFEYTERGRVVQSLEASKLERWESVSYTHLTLPTTSRV